jgi:hypothetical protein
MLKYDLHMEFRCSINTKVNNRKRPSRQLRYFRSIYWLAGSLLYGWSNSCYSDLVFKAFVACYMFDIHEYVKK